MIFRDAAPDRPFSADDSTDLADLWKYLQAVRGRGVDVLAISHNGNTCNGLMYDPTTLDGRPIVDAYATLRAENAIVSAGLGSLALVVLALEGIVCILLAAPLAIPIVMLGAALGRAIGIAWHNRRSPLASVAVLPMISVLGHRLIMPEPDAYGCELD